MITTEDILNTLKNFTKPPTMAYHKISLIERLGEEAWPMIDIVHREFYGTSESIRRGFDTYFTNPGSPKEMFLAGMHIERLQNYCIKQKQSHWDTKSAEHQRYKQAAVLLEEWRIEILAVLHNRENS